MLKKFRFPTHLPPHAKARRSAGKAAASEQGAVKAERRFDLHHLSLNLSLKLPITLAEFFITLLDI